MTIIKLPNGTEAILFAPEKNRQLAIVDLDVLQKLTKILPIASLSTLKQEAINNIDTAKTLDEMICNMKEDIAFHETINLINTYEPQNNEQ